MPPPAVVNGAALPKPARALDGLDGKSANNDIEPAPDSSTRSKEATPEPAALAKPSEAAPKADGASTGAESVSKARTGRDDEKESSKDGRDEEKDEGEKKEAQSSARSDSEPPRGKSEKGSRRPRGRRGRSTAPPPVVAKESPKEAREGKAAPKENKEKSEKADRSEKTDTKVAFAGPAQTESKASEHHGPVDLDEHFFAEGIQSEREALAPRAAAVHVEEEIDPKLLLKMSPDVRARRAKAAPVVKWVLVGALVLALGGLVKHRLAQGDQDATAREMAEYAATHPPGSRTSAEAPTPPAPSAAPAPTAADPAPPTAAAAAAEPVASAAAGNAAAAPVEGAQAAGDKGEAKNGAAPAASGSPAPAASGSAVAAATGPAPESAPAKTAAQEKRDCQVLLDRGAFGKAAEAGERSVAQDPTDGEAWLLLGAAYQAMGRMGEGKRAFKACLSQGKKGPLDQCKAMLQ